jgi:hypothetical protein
MSTVALKYSAEHCRLGLDQKQSHSSEESIKCYFHSHQETKVFLYCFLSLPGMLLSQMSVCSGIDGHHPKDPDCPECISLGLKHQLLGPPNSHCSMAAGSVFAHFL